MIDQLHSENAEDGWRWFIARYRPYLAGMFRRAGASAAAVDPLIEGFWGYLFESRAIERADRSGRFRLFLCGVARNYLLSSRRDGGRLADRAESGFELVAPADDSADDEVGLWAEQLLHLALDRLGRSRPQDERVLRGFYGLAETVGGEPRPRQQASEFAAELGCSANALHQLLFRARGRLRECLRDEVSVTVGADTDLDDELERIAAAISRCAPGIAVVRTEDRD